MLEDFEDDSEYTGIENFVESSKDTMMNIVYNALVENSDRAINSDSPINEKKEALNNVLQYFAKIEEYEKCSTIKKIIDNIKC